MKYFVEILKQFNSKQRVFVLGLLLFFTTGGVLLSQYFKTDDCRPLIEENLEMQKDFVKILQILREERLKNLQLDTIQILDETKNYPPPPPSSNSFIMDSIYSIAESHSK